MAKGARVDGRAGERQLTPQLGVQRVRGGGEVAPGDARFTEAVPDGVGRQVVGVVRARRFAVLAAGEALLLGGGDDPPLAVDQRGGGLVVGAVDPQDHDVECSGMSGGLYWGDLHNHCGISYGHGSLERALRLARQQLDFVSVTGHAFWPDMRTLEADRTRHGRTIDTHLMGFGKLHAGWDGVLKTMAAADAEGDCVVFPSYEWHSLAHGDHHVLYRDISGALVGGETLPALRQALAQQGKAFMLVPHHIGYMRGVRGT